MEPKRVGTCWPFKNPEAEDLGEEGQQREEAQAGRCPTAEKQGRMKCHVEGAGTGEQQERAGPRIMKMA